jgi:hypothetical protein
MQQHEEVTQTAFVSSVLPVAGPDTYDIEVVVEI